MTGHDEDQEQHLRNAQHLPSDGPHHHFTSIRHVADMRILPFELPNHISGIRRDDSESNQDDNSTVD